MVRVESVAGVSPSISVLSSKSVLRRDLRQQCSRVALMSAIGLAAAASASLMSPGQALADCAVGATTVACTTTVTTNTTYPNGAPNDRAYQVVSPSVLTGTVSTGSTVSGHGLSLTNNGTGGLDFVNNGTIRGDAADFVSGQASLSLASSAGDLRYSGSGDVIGDEDAVSDGIVAIQTGAGVIDLDIGGTVRGIEGVTATGTGTGAVNVAVRGAVSGIFDAGVHATGTKAVTVTVDGSVDGYYDGVAVATTSNTQDDVTVRGTGTIHAYGGAAISVANQGNGRSVIDFDGAVTDTVGDGISVRDRVGSGDIDIDVRSVAAGSGGILIHQDGYGSTSINVDEDVRGGYVGVSVTSVPGQAGAVDINIGGAVTAEAGIEVVRFSSTNLTPINITVGGPITATAGDGVNLNSRGDMNVNVGDITAAGDGIDIRAGNNGAAHISITGAGDIVAQGGRGITILNEYAQTVDINRPGSITGTDGDGIHIRNTTALAGDVNVLVGAVNATGVDVDGGAADGIDISYSSDVANLNLTVNGDVEADGRGVYAALTSAAAAGDIDIATNGAVRGSYGIDAINNGTGGVAITAAGPVTGTIYDGIYAQTSGGAISIAVGDATGQTGSGVTAQILNAPTSTNAITITADNLTGRTGVTASNSGLGGVSITTTGDVTGIIGDAVVVGSAGDVDVNIAGAVNGGQRGIAVQAAGDISVQTAAITTLNGNGVDIENQGAGEVNFEATGPITASNGHGVYVRDNLTGGDIRITTGAVSAQDETFNGIDIDSGSLTADITVVANGAVRADDYGIRARLDGASSGNIDVTANGSVSGRQGIFALTTGSGSVTVTANGGVTAGSGAGVAARSDGGAVTVNVANVRSITGVGVSADQSDAAGAGDVSVTAGTVSGSQGIIASNRGTGATSITATGPVTGNGAAGIGIQALGRGDISVATGGLVTGATRGMVLTSAVGGVGDISVIGSGGVTGLNGTAVQIDNQGAGSVTFANTGPITATNGHGVSVIDNAIGGDISITTGAVTVSAPFDGVFVNSVSTTANIDVVANGDIVAGGFGIVLQTDLGSSGNINVTANGSITAGGGIFATALGTGSVTVTAVGPITASLYEGIFAGTLDGGDITVTAGDVTSVDRNGINAQADGGGDIDITAGRVSGSQGIYVRQSGAGSVVVRANGAVTGTTDEGIYAEGDGAVSVEVADTVTGAGAGAVVLGGAAGAGDVSVTGTGGFVAQDGTGLYVSNEGSGRTTVDISGAVDATDGYGVFVENTALNAGDLSVTTGAVTSRTGNYSGIVAESYSEQADVSVTANGDIAAEDVGIQARLNGAATTGDVRVQANGAVTADTGIAASTQGSGAVSVTAVGPVSATDGYGIDAFSQGGEVAVVAGAVRSANSTAISAQQLNAAGTGNVDVTTTGAISGRVGIDARNAGTENVSVHATDGQVTATDTGIIAVSNGGGVLVQTDGVASTGAYGIRAIQGNATGTGEVRVVTFGAVSGATGISAVNNGIGDVGVSALGPISSTTVGIFAQSQGGDVTVGAADVASTGDYGVYARQASAAGAGSVHVTSTGALSLARTGIFAMNDGTGNVSVTATGPITASANGIYAQSNGGDVTVRAADVTSTDAYGVFAHQAYAGGVGDVDVATTGTVSGGIGIFAVNDGFGAVRVAATGPVTGTDSVGINAVGRRDVTVQVDGRVTGATDGAYIEGGTGGAGDISVTGTGGFTGQDGNGVTIQNNGNGLVTYDVSGAVSATLESGVVVRDTITGGDIRVTTGAVDARNGEDGLSVLSRSATADVTVVANGAITAGAIGINAGINETTSTGDVSVTANGPVSGAYGIAAANLGNGATSVTATGPINASDIAIYAVSNGDDLTVAAGDVTSTQSVGIYAQLDNAGSGDVNVTANAVTGTTGVYATSNGSGAVSVTTNGIVSASQAEGILALGRSAVSVSVANTVTGATRGVVVEGGAGGTGDISVTGNGGFVGQSNDAAYISNLGSGTVTVDIAGASGSAFGSGIVVRDTANGGDISVTTGSVIATTTDENAIDIRSQSETADITVVANGALTAGTNGVLAYLGDMAATGDINVRTNAAITGAVGINAQNLGLGDTGVTATGAVTASVTGIVAYARAGAVTVNVNDVSSTGNFGVFAQAGSTSTSDVTVTAGSVSGLTGVYASNDGTGAVSVTTTGLVTATGSNGIQAMSNGGDVTVNAANVAGPAGVGIVAVQQNAAGAGDVTVTAANVAGDTGVLASNAGSGDTRITTTGNVTGTSNGTYGIQSFHSGSGDAFIDANNVSGENAGIRADNLGTGVTDITVRGTVQGGSVGVSVYSDGDQDVRIANAGVIRSTAGLSSDRAIEASGGFIDFTNTGTLVGDINFQGDTSAFDNQGAWNTAGGDSTFAGVDDELVNAATGSILAMSTAGAQDVTLWRGLETFQNNGRLSLGDNGAGDVIMTSANTVFAAGSVLQLDVAGVNLADLFATTGTLTIEAGARLDVNFVQPLVLNGRYLIARADGGLTGRFDFEDRLLSAFVGLRDVYTATTASIEVGQLRAMMEAGLTPNQRETGAAADSLSDTNPLKTALLLLPNDAAAQDAFDQLSGEIHPAARRAMADDSRQFRDAVLDRLSDDRADGTVWGRVLVEERNTDADGNAAKVEHDARGLIFGADRALTDSLTVGLAGGWFNTNLDILHRDSSGSTQSQQALAYLGARLDRWGLRAGVGYAATSTDTQREIAFPGFSASPTADYDGSVLQGFVEAGYRLPMHGGYVEPFANLTMITAETDAFHEAGGPAALAVEARDESLTATTLGFRFQTDRSSAFSLRGTAGWRNLSGDLEPAGRHAFDGGTPFTVLGAAHSDTAAVGNLEALWRLSPNVTLSTAWDGVFGNKGEDHAISGRFKIAF